MVSGATLWLAVNGPWSRVFQRRLHSWLAALADPEGKADLPLAALRPNQFAQLWALAEYHGVLSAVLSKASRLADAKDAGRIVRRAKHGKSSAELLAAALAEGRKRVFRQSAATLVIRHQVAELTQAFSRRAVSAVLVKGVDFADRLYPDPAMRSFGDIDLLVPDRSVAEAQEALETLGYAPASSDMKYDAGYGERSFCRDNRTSATVELHWDLVNSPTVRRGVSVKYDDLQLLPRADEADGLLKPSPASLLLIACVHAAAGHAFDHLKFVCDICQAARQRAGEIDVDWLRAAVNNTGSRLALSLGLDLAGRILHEPACPRLARMLDLPRPFLAGILVTPGVVLRCHEKADSWRRQGLRELLKRPR